MTNNRTLYLCTVASLLPTFAQAYETRVLVREKCVVAASVPVVKEWGAIGASFLASVAGSLVSATLDAVSDNLSKDVVTTFTATNRGDNWYVETDGKIAISPAVNCVIGVVSSDLRDVLEADSDVDKRFSVAEIAKFQDALAKVQVQTGTAMNFHGKERGLLQLGITKVPEVYFEAQVVTTDAGPVFALDPVFFHYPKFLGDKPWFGSDKRDVMIGLEFSLVGGAFATPIMSFEGVRGDEITTSRARGMRLPWVSMPSTDGMTKGAGVGHPYNVKMTITETAKPGTLGKALAGAVAANKDAVKEAVETKVKLAVSSAERQTARNAATTAANAALATYFDAYAQWQAAVDAFNALPANDTAGRAKADLLVKVRESMLRNAQSAAEDAMSNAGIPFSPIAKAGQ